jgi:hypothetical protein
MTIEERVQKLLEYGDQFQSHLEACKQCEEHPFNLCSVGHRLLNLAGGMHDDKEEKEGNDN